MFCNNEYVNFIEKVMKNIAVKGNWNELKGKLKQKYANLTENDLLYEEGKDDELLGRLQKRLGKSRAELEKILSDL